MFHWAQRNADHIIPLYCFDPHHYQGTYHFNFPKTGPFRLRFLLDSVKDLRATLKKRGRWELHYTQCTFCPPTDVIWLICIYMPLCSTLLVRQGKPEDVVSDLIQQLGSVTAVAFHEEVRFRAINSHHWSYRLWECKVQSDTFCLLPEGGIRGKVSGEEAKGHLLPKQSQSSDFLGFHSLPQRWSAIRSH